MTETFPMTDRVRAAYFVRKTGLHVSAMSHYPEFDSWLNEIRAEAWDKGHGYPCDEWVRSEMCREYHPNPYRPNEK